SRCPIGTDASGPVGGSRFSVDGEQARRGEGLTPRFSRPGSHDLGLIKSMRAGGGLATDFARAGRAMARPGVEMCRAYDRAVKLPKELVEEIARITTRAQQVWQEARKANDFPTFRPWLEKIIHLKRQEAKAIGYEG